MFHTSLIPFSENNISEQGVLAIFTGQSNGEHGITNWTPPTPGFFKNVFSLNNVEVLDNINDNSKWSWKPFNVDGSFNLANRTVLYPYFKNITCQYAIWWQNYCNQHPNTLPNLYIIHLGESGQGFHKSRGIDIFNTTTGAPYRLWSTLTLVHAWAVNNLLSTYTIVRHLGLFHNQWETDSQTIAAQYYGNYLAAYLYNTVDKIAGLQVPFGYMVPRSTITQYKYNALIREDLSKLAATRQENVIGIDVAESSFWKSNTTFRDGIHYTQTVLEDFIVPMLTDRLLGPPTVVNQDGQFIKKNNSICHGTFITRQMYSGQLAVNSFSQSVLPNTSLTPIVLPPQPVIQYGNQEILAKNYLTGSTLPNVNIAYPQRHIIGKKFVVTKKSNGKIWSLEKNPSYNDEQGVLLISFSLIPNDTRFGSISVNCLPNSKWTGGAAFNIHDITNGWENLNKSFVYFAVVLDPSDLNYTQCEPIGQKVIICQISHEIKILSIHPLSLDVYNHPSMSDIISSNSDAMLYSTNPTPMMSITSTQLQSTPVYFAGDHHVTNQTDHNTFYLGSDNLISVLKPFYDINSGFAQQTNLTFVKRPIRDSDILPNNVNAFPTASVFELIFHNNSNPNGFVIYSEIFNDLIEADKGGLIGLFTGIGANKVAQDSLNDNIQFNSIHLNILE